MADPSRTASVGDGLDGLKRVGLPASAHQRRVEAVRTAATGLRDEVDDRIHPLKGHQLTMVARMARLTTGFAATLDAPSPQTLSSCEAIG